MTPAEVGLAEVATAEAVTAGAVAVGVVPAEAGPAEAATAGVVPAEAGVAVAPSGAPSAPSAPGTAGTRPPDPAAGDGDQEEPGQGRRVADLDRQAAAGGDGKTSADDRTAGRENGHGPGPESEGRGDQVGRSSGQAGKRPGRGGEHPGPIRAHRRILIGAVVCVALFAVAVAGIVITGPLNASGGESGLVTAYPSGRLAGGQFGAPGGSTAQQVPPSLTGIAAAGATVVAVGSQASLPDARPLILMSPDGGHAWQPAVLRAPDGASLAGAVPLMIAGGPGQWLAVAPDAAWTSLDGRTWQLGPGIAPLASGDRVAGLAKTPGGFAAVGENMRPQGTAAALTPVLWTSADGLAWQRRDASQLDLPAGKGRAVALRWVAARGDVLMVAGEVARTVVQHRGKRKVSVRTESWMVWRSNDNGARWLRARPPVSDGATASLSGLAATASGIVAIRPGHGARGVRDAVAYIWTPGHAWRFGGTLRARRGASLRVTSVAGSDHGAVVAGSAGRYRVAFTNVHGRSWHQTANLGQSSAAAVTGVTLGPGDEVVADGAARTGPFLLLAGAQRRPVGQAALAGAAAAGLSVNGLGAGPRVQVAVGHADGAPAIWSRPAGGRWVRMAVAAPPSWRGTGPGLTSVVHGDAGWLAVGGEGGQARTVAQIAAAGTLGSAVPPAGQQPILATSPDGRTWGPAAGAGSVAGPGLTLTGAAAGPGGYVVAGVRDDHGQPAAALWWSPDLSAWIPQGWWAGSAPGGTASAVLAVAAGHAGFAAVGAVGTHPAVWVYRNWQGWQLRPLAVPAGAGSAVLQRVSIHGDRIVALGVQARPSGPAPFAAVSLDGGRTWREVSLPVPGGSAEVTALVAVGGGFLGTGTLGTGTLGTGTLGTGTLGTGILGTGGPGTGTLGASGAQDVIVWWSPDGRTWHAVRPAGRWLSGPGTHQITGLNVSGGMLTGVGSAATGAGQRPVLWQARVR